MKPQTTKADESPEFKVFWEQVWRPHARHTDGRGDARDTFVRHVRGGADPQDIVDGARCFIRTMKDRDRDYIPLAASWINRRAYEDLAEQERTYQARLVDRQSKPPPQERVTEQRDQAMVERIRRLKDDALKSMKAPI